MAKSLTEALESTYSVTDCSNEVHDWVIPSRGKKFFLEAERLGLLRSRLCELCDGDGASMGREDFGYQLTNAGYSTLTAFAPAVYPPELRRFWIVGIGR